MEYEYKYEITFEINHFSKSLAVFCPIAHFEDILSKIKNYIKKSQYIRNRVSYKGKNLK